MRTKPGKGDISRIMQYVKSRFALRYNRINNRTGAVWNERFRDKVIEFSNNPERYLLNLLWYVAYNPVKARLVKDCRDYRYSSINCCLDESFEPPVPITLHEYFLNLGDTFAEQSENFLIYEEYYKKKYRKFTR